MLLSESALAPYLGGFILLVVVLSTGVLLVLCLSIWSGVRAVGRRFSHPNRDSEETGTCPNAQAPESSDPRDEWMRTQW